MGNSKCANSSCPLNSKCWRYQSKPNDYQWYNQYEFKDGVCDGFVETKN